MVIDQETGQIQTASAGLDLKESLEMMADSSKALFWGWVADKGHRVFVAFYQHKREARSLGAWAVERWNLTACIRRAVIPVSEQKGYVVYLWAF